MPTFNLVYVDDEFGTARRIEFEAFDAYGALKIAQGQAVGRTAELWEGGRKLCTLRRTGRDGAIWEIGPGRQSRPQETAPRGASGFGGAFELA